MKKSVKYFNIIPVVLLFVVALNACVTFPTPTAQPTGTIAPTQDEAKLETARALIETEEPASEAESGSGEEQLLVTPTLAPTATPGPIDELIGTVAESTGADRTYLLGLSLEDWTNLLISILIILLAVFIINRFLQSILRRMVKKTETPWDDEFVEQINDQIGWIVIVFSAQFATTRLIFLSPEVKHWLDQFYFVCYVFIFTVIIWKLVDVGEKWYIQRVSEQRDGKVPAEDVLRICEKASKIGVIDRAISFGHEGPFFTEVKASMYGMQQSLYGFIAGLGGRDVSITDIHGMVDLMQTNEPSPLNWIGVKR